MKTFKVYKVSNDEFVMSYLAESQNLIDGLGIPNEELYHVEQSEEQVLLDQKNEKKKEVKEVLKKLLLDTDWTQLKDAHLYLTEENISEFSVYRDQLRKQLEVATNNPWDVIIPRIPEEIKKPIE